MTLEEYLQQQGYVYRPENRVETDGGMSGNFGGYGKYRDVEGDIEGTTKQVFDEIERSETARYYDPSRFITNRETKFGKGVNTFDEGNPDQKRILDQINTGQLYITPRLIAGKVAGEPEGGGEGYSERKVYDLRDARTGQAIQEVTPINADKGIFNIFADDKNSSGYFNNYVSTDPKGFVNPVVSREQSQYASRANSSLNFIKDSIKGVLTMAAIAGTAGGAGATLGTTLGIGTQAGTAALNAGLAALKQGVDGKFDPVTLATTAALSYLGAGGTDAATMADLELGQAMTDMANSGGGYDPIAAIKDQAGANLDATYTPDSQYINQGAQGYESGLYPNTSVQPNLTVDDLYKNTTDLGGLDTPVSTLTPKKLIIDQNGKAIGNPAFKDGVLSNAPMSKDIDYLNKLAKVNGVDLGDPVGAPIRDMSTVLQPSDTANYPSKYSLDKIKELPGGAYDLAKGYIASKSLPELALIAAGAYKLSNSVGGGGGEQQPQTQAEADAAAKKVYTSGAGQAIDPDYMLQRRINAGNIYSDTAGYKALDYAEGGEVEHFAGGGLSNMLTRITQPIEKAILRPLGNAAPFLKDLAPYAGMAAGAMMGNPMMAAGIGGIASGFGKPGGFDMKRALMGGIAAYGMSNLMSGLEAAGGLDPSLPTSNLIAAPVGSVGENIPSAASNLVKEPSNMFSTRDPAAMQRGIGNLLQNSNTPAYKDAMTAFKGNVGLYNTGVPLVMGTTGMMGVDESNAMKQEYDKALGVSQADTDKYNARIAAGKKRAQQTMNENPYMFAMGGAIDDEYGGDDMNTVNGNMQNGFMGYAEGGIPRFLSGGGDGMSDSIKAKIEGTQEARLADGEFVIPADVVSHLGNGSSKAGAKQLYDMMNRVRKARTGNPKQGREIKPTKLMPV